MKKLKKTSVVNMKITPLQLERLRLITQKFELTNSDFLRTCIDMYWLMMEVEKGLETGKIEYNNEIYSLDLSQIAILQQEIAQILNLERLEDMISQQGKNSIERLKKPVSMAS